MPHKEFRENSIPSVQDTGRSVLISRVCGLKRQGTMIS